MTTTSLLYSSKQLFSSKKLNKKKKSEKQAGDEPRAKHNKQLVFSHHEWRDSTVEIISKVILENRLPVIELFSVGTAVDDGERYCSCGYLNCPKPGKHPSNWRNWTRALIPSAEYLAKMLQKKNRNYAIVAGRRSPKNGKCLIVVDVDQFDHPYLNSLKDSNTFYYRTGGGGYHFWFWTTEYLSKNSISLLAKSLDTRGANGYAIIPPSEHLKGSYHELVGNTIQDLPEWLAVELREKIKAKAAERREATGKANRHTTELVQNLIDSLGQEPTETKKTFSQGFWATATVVQIRRALALPGELVPIGTRNNVMFKLLSAKRVLGASETELCAEAQKVLSRFENPIAFSEEIPGIVSSVLKYKSYDTSYDKVNVNYILWLMKNTKFSFTRETPEERLTRLEEADRAFFAGLEVVENPGEDEEPGVSLTQISDMRAEYLQRELGCKGSVYKPQHLARKLVALGYKRFRTAKRNYWNIRFTQCILKPVEHYQRGSSSACPMPPQERIKDTVKEHKQRMAVIVQERQKPEIELGRVYTSDDTGKEYALYEPRLVVPTRDGKQYVSNFQLLEDATGTRDYIWIAPKQLFLVLEAQKNTMLGMGEDMLWLRVIAGSKENVSPIWKNVDVAPEGTVAWILADPAHLVPVGPPAQKRQQSRKEHKAMNMTNKAEGNKSEVVALHFSDLHSRLHLLNEHLQSLKDMKFDCWINTGDFFPNLPHGGLVENERRYQEGWFLQVKEYLFELLDGKPVITVDGNHDFISLADMLVKHGYPGEVYKIEQGKTLEFMGLKFKGFQHIPWCGGCWNHEVDVSSMEKIVRQTFDGAEDVDVLLTHTPPQDILACQWGVPALRDKLLFTTHGFRYHMFGHVHESPGQHEQNYIKFFNSAGIVQRVVMTK